MSLISPCSSAARSSMMLRRAVSLLQNVKAEWKGLIDDLGTIILAGLCLASAVIVASTFDGDLQGRNEIVAAILGTLSLFGLLAGLELADRLRMRRRGGR